MQFPLKVPVLLVPSAKFAIGAIGVPAVEVSSTVTVQDDAVSTATGVSQFTAVVVVREFTIIVLAPVPVLCVESPV